MKTYLKITFTLIFTTILLLGFTMPLNPAGNWYQQFMPNIGSRSIQDIFFLDSLTGWAVTNKSTTDTMFVLKTSNAGDDWSIHFRKVQTGGGFPGYNKIYFINQNTGFVCGVMGADKTTNGGANWTSINNSNSYQDISVLSDSLIFLVSGNSLTGGVYRTTNGGANWVNQLNLGSSNPEKVYMFNPRIGYISKNEGSAGYVRKTTDSGNSWSLIVNNDYFMKIHFTDSLTGWKNSVFGMKKTTDGGFNWVLQPMPTGGGIINSVILDFSVINKDTIWGCGGAILFPNSQVKSILYRTTNGGSNWLYQIPDTAVISTQYRYIQFTDHKKGWAYGSQPRGIHTSNGGNSFYVPVKNISNEVPGNYKLKQNYPNPFNPNTVIGYEISRTADVKISVYNIQGKLVKELVSQKHTAGTYEIDFVCTSCSSGIYFYTITVTNSKEVYRETKRMILLK